MDLFDYAEEQAAQKRVRRNDPEGSQRAARSFKAERSQRLVREALAVLGVATDEQIRRQILSTGERISEPRVRTARGELEVFGIVALVDERGGVTESGNACRTSRLVAEAVAS